MRRVRRLLLLAALAGPAVVGGFAAIPSAAFATHVYCENDLAPNEGCPPAGTSQWAHLTGNAGYDRYASHEVCIDEFLDPSGSGYYSGSTCVYYSYETAEQFPGGVWGYPRAWNGGSVTHIVQGAEEP
jgi:hypothetical protein